MASIPLAEIPNSPAVSDPVAIPQAGANTNLTGSLGSLQQSTMGLDAFSGKARGLADLGESGQRVAAVFGDFSDAITHANDVAGSAQATNIMETAYTNHLADMKVNGVPPDQWAKKWTDESLPAAKDTISQIQVSPRAAVGLNAQVGLWGQSATSKINLEGINQHIDDMRSTTQATIDSALARGDFSSAMQTGAAAVQAHIFSAPAWQAQVTGMQAKQLQNNIYANINSNPRQAAEELEKIKNNPDDPDISPLYKPISHDAVSVAQYAWQARRIAGVTASQTMQDILSGVQDGSIKTPADIDKMNASQGGIFTPPQLKEAYNSLKLDVPYDAGKAAQLHTDIVNADPQKDWNQEKRLDLMNRVSTDIPPQLRPDYTAMIQKQYNPASPDDKVATTIKQGNFNQVKDWRNAGVLGANGMEGSKVGDTAADQTAYNALAQKEINYQTAFEQAQENGQIKTTQDGRDFTYKFWHTELQQNAAKLVPQASATAPLDPVYASILGIKQDTPERGMVPDDLVSNVKDIEGFQGNAYPDNHQYSIGYGTKATSPNETIDEKAADSRLRDELSTSATQIDDAATRNNYTLTPGMRNALVSFNYNTGKGAYVLDTSGGDINKVKSRMALYVKSGGAVTPGLQARRQKELAWANE